MEVDLEQCCQIRVADRTSLLARTHITDLVAIIGAHEDWHVEMPVWREDESAASRVPSPSLWRLTDQRRALEQRVCAKQGIGRQRSELVASPSNSIQQRLVVS